VAAQAAGDSSRSIRVLVVHGGRALANTIDLILRHGSYVRRFEVASKEASAAIAEWKPHLLLVDIDLEAGAGTELINEARAGGPIGIIALTRRSDLRGKLDALERGADDYIGVPFVPDDLIARARAVLHRTHGYNGEFVPRLRIGELEIDVLKRTVRVRDRELHLTSLEQALLYLMVANDGSVLTREEILDALWGTDFVSESNIVDWHVRALRAKLEDDRRIPRYIETVSRIGYRFVSEPGAESHRPV
jgi:DNA-binding response OmpR family regulator